MNDLLQSLLSVVSPAFFVIVIGVVLGRSLKPDITALNRIALYGTVPALVLDSLTQTELGLANIGRLLAGYLAFMAAMLALSWLLGAGFEARSRRGFMATSTYSNSANLLLPVSLFAFGEAGLERALILYVVTTVLMFSTAPLVLAGGRGLRPPIKKLLGLPVLWAALLGLMFNLLDLAFPTGLARGIGILGDAAIPLVLLVLGMQIERSKLRRPGLVNIAGSAVKLVLGPLVAYGLGRALGAQGLDLAVLTLIGAMPPAVNTFMLALEFGGNAEEVAHTVVLATFCSLLTLSVVVALLT